MADEDFDPARQGIRESLCALGNGYFTGIVRSKEIRPDIKERLMSVQDDNKAFVRRLIDYINKDPFAPIDEFFAASYTYHNSSMPEVKDLSSLKEFNSMAYSAFPDIHFTIEDMVAEGDKVVYRGSGTGTHKGEFMGIAPTGKQVNFTSIVISRIANGKFQEDWESFDGIYVLQQLGAMPATQRSEK